eukprot:COSAG01_NODE_4406_length_5056_cov_124.577365_4_plen_75_part_00
MSRLFLSRNVEDGNGRAGQGAACVLAIMAASPHVHGLDACTLPAHHPPAGGRCARAVRCPSCPLPQPVVPTRMP